VSNKNSCNRKGAGIRLTTIKSRWPIRATVDVSVYRIKPAGCMVQKKRAKKLTSHLAHALVNNGRHHHLYVQLPPTCRSTNDDEKKEDRFIGNDGRLAVVVSSKKTCADDVYSRIRQGRPSICWVSVQPIRHTHPTRIYIYMMVGDRNKSSCIE
jgi:hypothetical protein